MSMRDSRRHIRPDDDQFPNLRVAQVRAPDVFDREGISDGAGSGELEVRGAVAEKPQPQDLVDENVVGYAVEMQAVSVKALRALREPMTQGDLSGRELPIRQAVEHEGGEEPQQEQAGRQRNIECEVHEDQQRRE